MEESEIFKSLEAKDTEKALELIATSSPEDLAALKSTEGRTLAHIAIQHLPENTDILKALMDKNVNPAIKDQNGVSPLGMLVATENGVELVKEQIIKPLLAAGSVEKLQQFAMAGWNLRPSDDDLEQMPAEVKEEVMKLIELQTRVSNMHAAIQENRLDDVKAITDLATLAHAQNAIGLPPLQEAVVFQNTEVVQHILETFPDAVNIKDNMNRTALHYAAVCSDDGSLYKILTDAGADDSAKDVLDKTAADYQAQPELLSVEAIKKKIEELLKPAEASTKDSRPASSADRAAEGVVPTAQADEPEPAAAEEQQPEPAPEPPKTPPKPATPPGPKVLKPVEMYVTRQPEQKAPPPSTVDGKYIAQHLGSALTLALAEIAEKRPWDPIEYLAKWLYKYHENSAYNKKKEELLQQIRDEEARQNEEEVMKFKRQEELKRFQEEMAEKMKQEEEERKRKEQEELQRSVKEAALAQKPQLPTVTEEGEGEEGAPEEEDDDPNVKDRDENGLNEMHKLAGQEGMDLTALIQLGYSIADRDAKGRTVRDIAEESGQKETVEAIDNYVKRMMEDGRTDILEQLAVEGYEGLEEMAGDNTPEVTKTFLERLVGLKEQIASAFKAAESGEEAELKEALEALPKLAEAKDKHGRSLLHMAVLAKAKPVVEYVASNFTEAVKARDNANRTPLHYASAVSGELSQILQTHGASPKARDALKRTPAHYTNNKGDIIAIQRSLGLLPPESDLPEVIVGDESQTAADPTNASEDETPSTEQLATVVTEPSSETETQQEQEEQATTA